MNALINCGLSWGGCNLNDRIIKREEEMRASIVTFLSLLPISLNHSEEFRDPVSFSLYCFVFSKSRINASPYKHYFLAKHCTYTPATNHSCFVHRCKASNPCWRTFKGRRKCPHLYEITENYNEYTKMGAGDAACFIEIKSKGRSDDAHEEGHNCWTECTL